MKKFFAKTLGWLGGFIAAAGAAGLLGHYSPIARDVGPIISAFGVHLASETSAQPQVKP